MKKIFYLISILILLSACSIRTPEIHGVVLDAETKQPVEGAWVRATIELNTKTLSGDVNTVVSVDQPHTRTDKEGKFIIPSKRFKTPSFPAGFGTEVESFAIGVSAIDDRGGRINYYGGNKEKDFGKGAGALKKLLRKDAVELTIYVKPFARTESEYFSHLQSLFNYCISGRSSVEVPTVKESCDEWELDYTITKHERYLEKISYDGEHAGGTLKQMGYLYKRKGDYVKAIEAFKKTLDYDKKRNIRFRRGEVENQTKELEQLLKEKQK